MIFKFINFGLCELSTIFFDKCVCSDSNHLPRVAIILFFVARWGAGTSPALVLGRSLCESTFQLDRVCASTLASLNWEWLLLTQTPFILFQILHTRTKCHFKYNSTILTLSCTLILNAFKHCLKSSMGTSRFSSKLAVLPDLRNEVFNKLMNSPFLFYRIFLTSESC